MGIMSRGNGAKLALALAASMSLAACGGGGGSGGGGGGGETGAAAAGVASKGILINALIRAYELDANGQRSAPLGEATTDEKGEYTLTIGGNYNGGPVLFELVTTNDTSMVCDVPAGCGGASFGQTVPLNDSEFRLQAIVPQAAKGQSLSVQLTPFTTMAARRALNDARGVTAEAVAEANSEMSYVLGVSVLSTKPADLTKSDLSDDANAATYAAFLAGVGSLAFKEGGAASQIVENLAASFEDGKFDATDPVTIQALVEAVREIANAPQLQDKLPRKVKHTLEVIESEIAEDGSYDPQPSSVANEDALAKGKDLVQQARTLIRSVAKLEDPLVALGVDAHTANVIVSQEVAAMFELVGQVASIVVLEGEEIDPNTSMVYELRDSEGGRFGLIRMTWVEDENGEHIEVKSEEMPDGLEMWLHVFTDLRATEGHQGEPVEVQSITAAISGQVGNGAATLALNSLSFVMKLKEPVVIDPVEGAIIGDPRLDTASLTGMVSIVARDPGNPNAEPPVEPLQARYYGGVRLEAVGLELPNAEHRISIQSIRLGGGFESSRSGVVQGVVALDVENAATFDTLGYLKHERVIDVYKELPVDQEVLAMAEQASTMAGADQLSYFWYSWYGYDGSPMTEVWYKADGRYTGQSWPGDPLGAVDYVTDRLKSEFTTPSGAEPEVSHVYMRYYSEEVVGDAGVTVIGGRVDIGSFENAEYFLRGTISVTLDLKLTGHPEATVTATLGRSEYDSRDVLVTFRHGGDRWTLSARKVIGKQLDSVDITSATGVTMTLVPNWENTQGQIGVVKVDGEQAGRIEATDNGLVLLRWSDGSFESIR